MLVMRRLAFALMAQPVVHIMCGNDQYNCRDQKIKFILVKKLLGR